MKEIELTQGYIAIVDEEDFERVNAFKWYAQKSKPGQVYARRERRINKKKVRILMHRFIMNVSDPNIQVDHKNGNKLDNRKENLRIASNQQNNRNHVMLKSNNSSGYRGVSLYKKTGKYVAYISNKDGKRKHLGTFEKAEEAAKSFDKAAKQIYGEFCGKLNYE